MFCKEAVMWKPLKHRNIVPLLGVTHAPFQLISEWVPGGILPEYIKNNPGADRLGLVGIHPSHLSYTHSHYQLSDVAEALNYLHSSNVIHGDIEGVRDGSNLASPSY
jgi:serine/threonine protein kinase